MLAIAWEARPEAPPVHNAELAWSTDAQRIASWRAERSETPGCLVVVRQPLKAPDPAAQRDWVSTVLRALDGDATPPEGLLTANFFAGRDGASAWNRSSGDPDQRRHRRDVPEPPPLAPVLPPTTPTTPSGQLDRSL